MGKRSTSHNNRKSNKDEDGGFASETASLKLDQLIELTYGSLKTYTEKFGQRNIDEAIAIAMKYARGGSELIQAAILMKIDFFGAGFKIKVDPGRETMTDSLNSRIDDWIHKHDLRQLSTSWQPIMPRSSGRSSTTRLFSSRRFLLTRSFIAPAIPTNALA